MQKTKGLCFCLNSEDSLVLTHPTTNSPACGLNAARSRVGVARVSLGCSPLYYRATRGDKRECAVIGVEIRVRITYVVAGNLDGLSSLGPLFFSLLTSLPRSATSFSARPLPTCYILFLLWISGSNSLMYTGSGKEASPLSMRSILASWSRSRNLATLRESNFGKNSRSMRSSLNIRPALP
jgi:hypothetical protein